MATFAVGFAQADPYFGIPAENINDPRYQQVSPDGCDFAAEASVLRDYGFKDVTEKQLQMEGAEQGWYEGHGTPLDRMGSHLASHGVPYTATEGNGVENMVAELARGHEIIIAVDSGEIWTPGFAEEMEDTLYGGCPDHAIIVNGISIADNTATITDSGNGDYRCEVPLDRLVDAWADSNFTMVSTDVTPEEFMALHSEQISGMMV